jgi:hypothetical protein
VVANSLFITGSQKEDNVDLDQETGSSKKEWTRGHREIYTHIENIYIEKIYKLC